MTWDGLFRMAMCLNCRARLTRRFNTYPKSFRRILRRLAAGQKVKI